MTDITYQGDTAREFKVDHRLVDGNWYVYENILYVSHDLEDRTRELFDSYVYP